ncbi:MAG: ferrous iron transporter B [Fluviicola sp.]|nr:ferrous iron transporter B [Fluviicola sp.]MBP6271995.1 ferrous iron transporter B [Fluviicola sp.]
MKKIALFGNPNTGKSSIFNRLTGLKQRVGNFPGVTVDKQIGYFSYNEEKFELTDFPGTYSVYPRSTDEKIVYDVISNPQHPDFPEAAIIVIDASNLERNLLLFSQIYDLGIPTVLLLNMTDVAARKEISIDIPQLQAAFPATTIIRSNARIGTGITEIKQIISENQLKVAESTFGKQQALFPIADANAQAIDTDERFHAIQLFVQRAVKRNQLLPSRSKKIDRWLTHPIFGFIFFFILLLIIFQSVFTLASYPMDIIDSAFGSLSSFVAQELPAGLFTELLANGIIPGIGGVLVFVPQIALLFFLLSILEETGYMARVVFMMDKLMRPFGLNGKSVVPLISSSACAIPGIMSARTINSWQERLTTIFVAPLISCSARIPVYTLLIHLVIPNKLVVGFISLQGLVLFSLYLLGLIAALATAWVFQFFLKNKQLSVFLLELPPYKSPRWANVGIEVVTKAKVFVTDAGKIIVAISILLWALATFGPSNNIERAVNAIPKPTAKTQVARENYDKQVAAVALENSYIGVIGKSIEPIIAPIGYDWKMGICLITSFAAREVFVGSLATIYSVDQTEDDATPLITRLREDKKADGTKTYTLASGLSLLVFYVFAMQCMATLAVVKRETKSWKWPLIQLFYMGALAYFAAYFTFQLFQ